MPPKSLDKHTKAGKQQWAAMATNFGSFFTPPPQQQPLPPVDDDDPGKCRVSLIILSLTLLFHLCVLIRILTTHSPLCPSIPFDTTTGDSDFRLLVA
jgi:hypothetical protein